VIGKSSGILKAAIAWEAPTCDGSGGTVSDIDDGCPAKRI